MVDNISRKYPVQVVIASYSLLTFFFSLVSSALIYTLNINTLFVRIVRLVLIFLLFVTPILSLTCGIDGLFKIRRDSSLQGKAIAISNILISGIIIVTFFVLFLAYISAPSEPEIYANREPDAMSATPMNPITLSRSAVAIGQGERIVVRINVFNLINQTMYETQPYVSCPSLGDRFSSLLQDKEIKAGSSANYVVILETAKDAPIGKDLCSVCVKDNSSNGECNNMYIPVDLVLEVRK